MRLHATGPWQVPKLPVEAPTQHAKWLQRLAAFLMRLFGWRIEGAFPNVPKMMIIAVPHSSNWDGLWGILTKIALGVRIEFIAKKSLFIWPFGPLLRMLGAVPIDRSAAHGVVDDMARMITNTEKRWLCIAPEGTRKKVEKWKTGFWYIAKAAKVPVFVVYFHYPDKVVGLGRLFELSDDMNADIQAMRDYLAPFQGKNHGV